MAEEDLLSLPRPDARRGAVSDLAVAIGGEPFGSVGSTMAVLLGVGDGTFLLQQTYAVEHNPRSVVSGDLNSDGVLDLVTANKGDPSGAQGDTVSVLLGNGDGTFQAQQTYTAGDAPASVVCADISCCWAGLRRQQCSQGPGRVPQDEPLPAVTCRACGKLLSCGNHAAAAQRG